MAITPPATLARPFAESGDKANIPDITSTAGVASLTEGFPPVTQLPLSAGGIPPRRLDFNGMFNMLSQFAFWAQSGGQSRWNSALDYASPCMVFGSDGKIYFGVAPSGPGYAGVGAKNPTVAANQGTYWVSLTDYALEPATATKLGGIKVGDGFKITAVGLLSVDPDSFSSDLITELMKQLRVPEWLSGNRTWYVRSDGNDSNDGSADTPAKAFKTIQKALNYISDNYNIGSYAATISVGPGDFAGFRLPKYSSSTGRIIIQGSGKDVTCVSASDSVLVASVISSGIFTIKECSLIMTTTASSNAVKACINANAGTEITLESVKLIVNEHVANAGRLLLLYIYGGNVVINSDCEFICNGLSAGNRVRAVVTTNGGTIYMNMNVAVSGRADIFLFLDSVSIFTRNPNYLPVFSGSFEGQRYNVVNNSICKTQGGGPDYFPGTIAGYLNYGGQYS